MYFVGVAFPNPTVALWRSFLAAACWVDWGGSNHALGFAYLAATVKQEDQTRTNSVLAITRILGMTMGPAANLVAKNGHCLDEIFGSHTFTIDPLNSVGFCSWPLEML
jgi:hypothetical protein